MSEGKDPISANQRKTEFQAQNRGHLYCNDKAKITSGLNSSWGFAKVHSNAWKWQGKDWIFFQELI